MTLDDIKNYFGSGYLFEKETGMSHVNLVHWKKRNLIPYKTQVFLEHFTGGKLKADESEAFMHFYPERLRDKKKEDIDSTKKRINRAKLNYWGSRSNKG